MSVDGTDEGQHLLAVVDAAYTAYFGGDTEGAIRHCADDAMWHAVTPVPDDEWSGSHPIRRYWEEILPGTVARMPGYRFDDQMRHGRPPFVVTHLRSSHGAGIMVFRVIADKITDIWVMNAEGRQSTGYF